MSDEQVSGAPETTDIEIVSGVSIADNAIDPDTVVAEPKPAWIPAIGNFLTHKANGGVEYLAIIDGLEDARTVRLQDGNGEMQTVTSRIMRTIDSWSGVNSTESYSVMARPDGFNVSEFDNPQAMALIRYLRDSRENLMRTNRELRNNLSREIGAMESFKQQVKDTAMEYARKNNWCDEVKRALNDLGISTERTMRIRATVSFTIETDDDTFCESDVDSDDIIRAIRDGEYEIDDVEEDED